MSTHRLARPVSATAALAAVALLPLASTADASAPGVVRQRVVLSVPGGVADLGRAALAVVRTGGTVIARYPVAGALVVSVPAGWVAPTRVTRVVDRAVHVSGTAASSPGSTVRQSVGGWSPTGGAGVTVAVVDTGVADVPDLAGRVDHVDVTGGGGGDDFGHGTFMAGLVAGSGAGSGGAYAGLAPAARLLDVRVAGTNGDTSLSRVLAGLQAVADRRRTDPSLRVLNLSLSEGDAVPAAFDPLSRGLEQLWADGVTVVVAAGNDGPREGSISAPASDPVVLAVGAVDEGGTASRSDDATAAFSGRGGSKPEIVAPGVSLVSLRAPGSVVDAANPAARVADGYFRGTGTSMSAAVTAGAVAVLLASRPELTPDDVKALLTSTAYDVRGRGAGALDLAAALQAPVPEVAEAAAWSSFATAWRSGDAAATARAWSALSPGAQRWAAQAFAVSVLLQPGQDPAGVTARAWSARAWSARAWSARAWSARAWSSQDWLARAWSARAWSSEDWAARAWSARAWSTQDWSARAWSSQDWSARAWSSEDWAARAWSARAWSDADWADLVWSARAWSSQDWTARAWSARAWSVAGWGG